MSFLGFLLLGLRFLGFGLLGVCRLIENMDLVGLCWRVVGLFEGICRLGLKGVNI